MRARLSIDVGVNADICAGIDSHARHSDIATCRYFWYSAVVNARVTRA
jgi:hypothetical protein